jgi:hypothetical protein
MADLMQRARGMLADEYERDGCTRFGADLRGTDSIGDRDTARALRAIVRALESATPSEAASVGEDGRDAARWRAVRDPIREVDDYAIQPAAWVEGPGNKHIESDWLTGERADAAADELVAMQQARDAARALPGDGKEPK